MPTYNQDERFLSLTTPLVANELLLQSADGSEGISELFEFDLEVLATPDTAVSALDLIGKRVTFSVQVSEDGTQRPFNGMVASLETGGGDPDFNTYRLRVVPALWLLGLNTQTQVFQDMTVLDVVKKVLSDYSITPTDDTQGTYPTLEYCTQYRETDLNFVLRLLEQHGIFYYFTHSTTNHTLVFGDTSAQLQDCAVQSSFRYEPNKAERQGFYDMVVESFASRSSLTTGKFTLWDYRFTQFATASSSSGSAVTRSALGSNEHEFYDYADSSSAYLKTDSGDGKVVTLEGALQLAARDATDTQSLTVQGRSNASPLQTGFTFALTDYPQDAANTRYLVTRVTHHFRQQPTYRTESAAMQDEPYSNSFEAQPASLAYRPLRRRSKPRVHGVVTGKVVAPSGEESYLDKYGRVCVQFWWDRNRQPNTTDNTLLRVAQSWAGSGWGTYFWPRLNDEVLIDFLDGDPDAPIVVGSLYNGVNMPKYNPASQYTRAGILTRSSKQGGAANANELRFDDLKGSEQIFLNAEKDLDVHVENDWHTQVDNDRHLTVKGNQYDAITGERHSKVTKDSISEVDGDLHLAVQGKQMEQTTGDKSEKISGDHLAAVEGTANLNVTSALNQKIGTNYSLQVGANLYGKAAANVGVEAGAAMHLKGGATVVIESGPGGLSLSGPGGFIAITAAGITIQGAMVMINSGGASLQGTPAEPEDPQPPTAPKSPTAPTQPKDDPRAQD